MIIKKENTILYFTLVYFAVFSILFVFLFPPFEGPDENLHLQYINYFSKNLSLPNQYEGYKNKNFFVGQGHQHPLYYILTGLTAHVLNSDNSVDEKKIPDTVIIKDEKQTSYVPYYKIFDGNMFEAASDKNTFYLLRILSVIAGLFNLFFIFKISELIFKDSNWKFFPVVFAATLPQFIYIASVVNNDNLANLFSTICIYFLFKIIYESLNKKNYLLLGLFLGLGILTKKTILFTIPAIFIILIYIYFKRREINYLKYFLLMLLVALVICGWIFFRNYFIYGDLFATKMEIDTMPQFIERKSIFSFYFIKPFLPGLYQSFIGLFAWMNLPIPKIFYLTYLIIIIASVTGIFINSIKAGAIDNKVLISIIFILSCLLGIMYFNLIFTQYQGRYMFPVISLFSVLFAYGFQKLYFIKKESLIVKLMLGFILINFVAADLFSVLSVIKNY